MRNPGWARLRLDNWLFEGQNRSMTLREIVNDYRAKHQTAARAELDTFRCEPTLASAVKRACLATNSHGRRESHHARRERSHLEAGAKRLLEHLDEIESVTTFAKLHSLCAKLLGPLRGLGELYIYDTAVNIGANRGLFPKVVYLHAGTRDGAKALGFHGEKLFMSELPPELRALEPWEVENVLCMYKADLSFSGHP